MDANDLIQQTRAADAARAQVEIASQGLWTTWFQTIGGLITLAAAIGAAAYARDAAKHGKTSAEAAMAIVSNDRAWLCFERIDNGTMNGSVSGRPVANGYLFAVCWKNCGRSPAIGITCTVAIDVVPNGNRNGNFVTSDDGPNISGVVGQGTVIKSASAFLDDDQSILFGTRQVQVLIYCRVEYFDVFSHPNTQNRLRVSEVTMAAIHGGGTIEDRDGLREAIDFITYGEHVAI